LIPGSPAYLHAAAMVDAKAFVTCTSPMRAGQGGHAAKSKPWLRIRGAVRAAGAAGRTGAREVGDLQKSVSSPRFEWPARSTESPASSRAASPNTDAEELWRLSLPSGKAWKAETPSSWQAMAARAQAEGRAQAAAEIALLRLNSGLRSPRRQVTVREENSPRRASPRAATPTLDTGGLSSLSTSAGSALSSPLRRPGSPVRASSPTASRRPKECKRASSPGAGATEGSTPKTESTRERVDWSPCKWPPSTRWPSTQLPQNVNLWPVAGDEKPRGLDTWTHLLFSTGLRCSPSEIPYKCPRCSSVNTADSAFCRKCGTRRQEDWHVKDRPNSPTSLGQRSRTAPCSRSISPQAPSVASRASTPASTRSTSVGQRSVRATVSQPQSPRLHSDRSRKRHERQGVRSNSQQAIRPPPTRSSSPRRKDPSRPRSCCLHGRQQLQHQPLERATKAQAAQLRRSASVPRAAARPKLTPADLVRLQRELQAQMEMVSKALATRPPGPRARPAKLSGRQLKQQVVETPNFRF